MAVCGQVKSTTVVSESLRVLAALAVLALPSAGAQFEFNALVRLGENSLAPNAWETGLGPNNGTYSNTANANPYWTSGESRQFQLTYTGASNNLELRLFSNNGATSNLISVTPATAAVTNTTWRLPASSFFATALAGGNVSTTVTVSSLQLAGLSGALNIVQPLQQTTLQAASGVFLPTATVTQSQDVVFQGDASGSWRLQGFVTMNFTGLGGGGNSTRLQFGVDAIAESATPEPSTWVLFSAGLLMIGWGSRRRKL
jgi:hypothetical protein